MATINLLNNLPVKDLTPDNDYLGIIDKGNLIANFLKANKEQFADIKMFTLYGEWGSGKSTLMKYIQKEVQADFNTYFFEAWEYEKDENLAMSLLEYIDANNKKKGRVFRKGVLKYGGRILRGLAKSVKVSVPIINNGPSLEIDPTGLVDELSQKDNLTFYQILEKFKKEFVVMEDRIKAQTQKSWNLVFIDDLDRCEPEQVLNLLSAIKLFFTYGQRTIFFCGIDKKAVEEAVKTKYGEVVKANEYLEKIFDISFTMPPKYEMDKYFNLYFDDTTCLIDGVAVCYKTEIITLFKSIGLNNPRKLKKVLNKYGLLASISRLQHFDNAPKLFVKGESGNQGSVFETLLVIYLIILHEFFPSDFQKFGMLKEKLNVLRAIHNDKQKNFPNKYSFVIPVLDQFVVEDFLNIELRQISSSAGILLEDGTLPWDLYVGYNLPLIFFPSEFEDVVYHNNIQTPAEYIIIQNVKTIDNKFYDFIKSRYYYLLSYDGNSGATFNSIKDFVALSL